MENLQKYKNIVDKTSYKNLMQVIDKKTRKRHKYIRERSNRMLSKSFKGV